MVGFIKKHKILCAVIALLIVQTCIKTPVLTWVILGAVVILLLSKGLDSLEVPRMKKLEKDSNSHMRDSVYCINRCIYCGKEFYAPPNVLCKSCARKNKQTDIIVSEEAVLKELAEHDARVLTELRSASDRSIWIKAYTVVRHSKYLLALDEMDRKGQKLPGKSFEDDYNYEPAYLRRHLTRSEYVQYRRIVDHNTPKTTQDVLDRQLWLSHSLQREHAREEREAAFDWTRRVAGTEIRFENVKSDLMQLSHDLDAKGMHDAAFQVRNQVMDMNIESFSQISYSQMKDMMEDISTMLGLAGYFDASQEVRDKMLSLKPDEFLR